MRPALVWLCAASIAYASCDRSADPPKPAATAAAVAGRAPADEVARSEPPGERTVTVAASTPLSVRLEDAVASEASHGEELVRAIVVAPVIVDGVKAIPSGSHVEGTIAIVRRAGQLNGREEVGVRFTRLVVKTASYPIRTALAAHVGAGSVLKTELLDAVTVHVPIRPFVTPST